MSNILKGIINEAHYPEDPDEYEAMFGGRRKPKRTEPDDIPEPHDPFQDYYRKQDQAQAQYKKEVDVQYINKEGVAPNGKRYNSAFVVRSKTPQQGDNEIYKFNDAHWGAKTIVDTVKKKPDEHGEPYLTMVYYVDNHKHGYWKPWKDEQPVSKGLEFSEAMMSEGISQERLADVLCHRIEMRYPDIYQQYEYDDVYRAVDDVASFHAGAEELGSSDINIMIREVFKQLKDKSSLNESRVSIFESIGQGDKYFKTWEKEIHPILCEVALKPEQINQLFKSIEQGAGRSVVGKTLDFAKSATNKISDAWFNKFGGMLQSSAPVQAFDQKWEDIKSKVATKNPELAAKLAKYGEFAKNNPKLHKFLLAIGGSVAAALGVALAGGVGAGALAVGTGAGIATGIINIADRLLQGQKASTAIGRGATTGAIAGLAAGITAKIASMVKAGFHSEYLDTKSANGIMKGAYDNNGRWTFITGKPEDVKAAGRAFDQRNWQAFYAIVNKVRQPEYLQSLDASREIIKQAAKHYEETAAVIKNLAQIATATASGATSAATAQQPKDSLSENQIQEIFGFTGNKFDAAKLEKAWQKAGSPTDSEEIAKILKSAGVDDAVISKVFADLHIATPAAAPAPAPAPSAVSTPTTPTTPTAPQTAVRPAAPRTKNDLGMSTINRDNMPFNQAIKAAKTAGEKTFLYKGKRFPVKEEELDELSTQKLAQYKTAAAADAKKADSEGDYERGNKRFSGMLKATKKQFDNETKPKRESAILKGLQNEDLEIVDENLRKWFKEKWVRFGPDGKIRGACARGDDSEGKPKCLPQSKAHSLGKKGRASAAARKRREDPNPERSGKAINVATKKKSNEDIMEGLPRNAKEKKLYELLEFWGHFISFKTVDLGKKNAVDQNAQQEIMKMRQHYNGPVLNGMTFNEITKGDLWQNSKVIPHLLKYIYQGIPYIEERIKKFIVPDQQQTYLSAIDKIKSLYREVVAQYSGQQGVTEEQLDEKCWDTHKQVGMKKKGDRMVPNCVPKESVQETQEKCPHCNGPMFEASLMNEKKDACYYKVKSRYKVWPSAYASGALVKCRKKGSSNWGTGGKKNEGMVMGVSSDASSAGSKVQGEAANPSQQAAIAIAMKKAGKKPKGESAIMKGLVGETLGTPYPGTYEQETAPIRKKGGQERTQSIAFEEEQIDEKWSEKYKRSIDCSHPKGFSQRAHCQGRTKHKE